MAARKSAPAQPFDYDCLGEAATVAREAAGKIRMRCDAEVRAKSAWTRHGLDILRIRRAAKHGHFKGWVQLELPFTVRLAELMSDAAAMLADHLKSENFSSLPVLDKAVTYTLAARSTPQAVRDEFLPRLLKGEKGLRKLVNAALNLETAEPAQDDVETEPAAAVSAQPSHDEVEAVESMTDAAFRTVMSALAKGRAEEIFRACQWRDAKPVVPLAERARAVILEPPPLLSLMSPDLPAIPQAEAENAKEDEAESVASIH